MRVIHGCHESSIPKQALGALLPAAALGIFHDDRALFPALAAVRRAPVRQAAFSFLAMLLHKHSPELSMKDPWPTRRWISRLLTVSIGLALFLAGVRIGEFGGLMLMIVGLVPAIIGAADVSLMTEIRDERAHRLEQRRPGWSHMSASIDNPSRAAGHVTGQKATSPLALRHSAHGLSVNRL